MQIKMMQPSLRASPVAQGQRIPCNAGRCGFDPWVGKVPWRRAWQPTPAFSLENPVDRGAWRAAVQGVAESDTTETQHARDAFWVSTLLPRLFLSVGVRMARLLSSRRELTVAQGWMQWASGFQVRGFY